MSWQPEGWQPDGWQPDGWQPEDAEAPPELLKATVSADGTTLTLSFSEACQVGAGGNAGFVATMSGGASALSYSAGDGTARFVYGFARTIDVATETGSLAYTQPGDGIEDLLGNDLATFSGRMIVLPSGTWAHPAAAIAKAIVRGPEKPITGER